MFVWHEYENAAEAAQSLADAVADALQGALDEKGGAVLAVSGGRSPIAFFNALSQKDLDWKNVGITLADERIVPTNHADSNTGLVREYLLKNKAAAAVWIPMVEDGKTETELHPDAVVDYALKHYKQPDVLIWVWETTGIRLRFSQKLRSFRRQSTVRQVSRWCIPRPLPRRTSASA